MAVFWRTFGFFHCANFLFILIPHLLLHIMLWAPARSRRHRRSSVRNQSIELSRLARCPGSCQTSFLDLPNDPMKFQESVYAGG